MKTPDNRFILSPMSALMYNKPFSCPAFRTLLVILTGMALVFFTGCASRKPDAPPNITGNTAVSGAIQFYRGPLNHLDAVRDGTCPMHPSCSAYAMDAFDKHGPLTGFTMTFDRLIRCGRDETDLSQKIYMNNRWRTHDPVRHNDFWWHEKGSDMQ